VLWPVERTHDGDTLSTIFLVDFKARQANGANDGGLSPDYLCSPVYHKTFVQQKPVVSDNGLIIETKFS